MLIDNDLDLLSATPLQVYDTAAATTYSTNVLDLGAARSADGTFGDLEVVVIPGTALNTGTLTVNVLGDDDATAGTDGAVVASSGAVTTVAGKEIVIRLIKCPYRYLYLSFVTSAAATAGTVAHAFVRAPQSV
jgi:hypothetical protein